MDRIVVGVGGSKAGGHALGWAATLASATGAEIVLVSAFGPTRPVSAETYDSLEAARRQELEPFIAQVTAAGATCTVRLVYGDPRVVLRDAVTDLEASLLVVGRQGPGGSAGLFHVSSVAEYLAHHVEVPLAVISLDSPTEVRRMVVGVDGSPNAHAAAAWSATTASASGAELWAVYVHEPFLEWTPEPDPEAWRAAAETAVREDLASELTGSGVDFHSVALRGRPPAEGLVHAAAERDADLLVVGLRGIGGFTHLRAGGSAFTVLHTAPCSVVLVPPTPGG